MKNNRNISLSFVALILLISCTDKPPQEPKQLKTVTITMPDQWAPHFAEATTRTVTDTLQFPERGMVTLSAEILEIGSDTSFVHSITVTQNEAAKGVVFTASVNSEPMNASQEGKIATRVKGYVFSEATDAVKYQMNSRSFVVHSRDGILKE